MPEPEFIVVRPVGGGQKFVIDRINLTDDYEEVGEPVLLSGGPVPPKPHVSLPKASAVKDGPVTGNSNSKKEG